MKIDIKSRLYIGFTAAIMLVLMVGFISYGTFKQGIEEADNVQHSYKVINQLTLLQALMLNMEAGRRGFRSTNQRTFLEPYYNSLSKFDPELSSLYLLVEKNPVQKSYVRELESSTRDLMSFWRGLGEDASAYTREIIIGINTREKAKVDVIRRQFDEIKQQELLLLNRREIDNQRSVSLAIYGLFAGIALVLLIVGVLIYVILREFNSRTRAEKSLTVNNRELSRLNRASNEQNWLLGGLANVNNSLQGQASLQTLCESVLNQLLKNLSMAAGAIYLFNNYDEKLHLVASCALSNNAKKLFALKEGLVGNAATQTNVQQVKNIPPQYVTIQGATTNISMAEVVFVPLWNEGTMLGVIELLAIEPVDDRSIELLKLVENNIVIAINSAQSQQEILELLAKVQQQKGELESQQEELRQANEELSMQTEILQSSEEELRVQEEELREINTELEEKNEAIENAGNALFLKAKELETTSRFKSEFLANMSHELRTPLNSILILARLLGDNRDLTLTEKQVSHARIIHKSGSDLLQLINDILDLSKIEAGKVDVEIAPISIAACAADIELFFQAMVEEKGLDFSVTVAQQLPSTFETDRQKLDQVLKNLLSNAIKFTPSHGKVQVTIQVEHRPAGDFINFIVADNGIGILPEKLQLIFDAFQQADGSTSRKYGGTGLGLSITKQLVKLLGGKIEVESAVDKGCIFTLTLPVVYAGHQQPAVLPKNGGSVQLSAPNHQQILSDDRNSLEGEKVLLIVEDDVTFAGFLRNMAREKGFKTVVALQGDEGLEYINTYKPDAIILDMQLPVVSGAHIIQHLKESPTLKKIPVHIVSSADKAMVDATHAMSFLQKPITPEDLEKVFVSIKENLKAGTKKVLLLTGESNNNELLQSMVLLQRNFEVECYTVYSPGEALARLQMQQYDCVIADLGNTITSFESELQTLASKLLATNIPLIIYLDQDLSAASEMKLKKISEVIVRKSPQSHHRLADELELFLFKIQQNKKTGNIRSTGSRGLTKNYLKQKTVLVVDDDMRNVFALAAALEQEEINVITASDGREAVGMIETNPAIDLVLMDIMMPEMDGYEAIGYIRNKLQFTRLPVIALTAKAMADDRQKCIAAGASDYISKPVDLQKLLSLMRVWLS